MRIDFIEAQNSSYHKLNKKKIIITILIAIIFIAFFSVLGIKAAEGYNKKLIAKKRHDQMQVVLPENNQIEQQNMEQSRQASIDNINNAEQTIENMNINPIPVYSENAKKKMKFLYTTNEKVAYLTFDDGPSQTVTPQILDVLKREKVRATFFVLGSRVRTNPDLVKREYEEGHYIANHGYSHDYDKMYKSVDNVINEYNKCEKEIRKAIGVEEYESHLFRFPGGSNGGKYAKLKAKAKKELNNENISFIDWNALTSDAAGANTKGKLLKNLKNTIKNKNSVVVLMHDASNKILTAETLPDVIQVLREQGYTFDNFYSIMK